MSKMVRIQSTTTINVTCGLQHKDLTNPDAHIPERLKVSPEWCKCTVLIREGVGNYPAEIAEWETVKALVIHKVLTIGEVFESEDEADKKIVEDFEYKKSTMQANEEKRQRRSKKALEDIAD